jgi:hypothetical protein
LILNELNSADGSLNDDVEDHLIDLLCRKRAILTPDPKINMKIPPIVNVKITIDSLQDEFIPANFRFRNKEQLYRLLAGLEFADEYVDSVGNKFTSEEILLAGLYRLHSVNVLGDEGWMHVFGWKQLKIFIVH